MQDGRKGRECRHRLVFCERTPIRDFYQVHPGEQDRLLGGTRILPFRVFCEELDMP